MATAQSFQFADSSTLANFKAWAGAISSALSTFGWVKSSDTGQTAPSSASAVPAASAFIYEIWTMQDSLQSTNPVYLKVEYGSGTSTSYPAMAFTVGSGSNGAGVLTNAGTRVVQTLTATGGTTTTYECDFAGSTGYFAMALFRGYATPFVFSIERSYNTSGTATASYVTTLQGTYPTTTPYCFQQTLFPAANGGPVAQEKYGLTMQTSNTSASFNNTVAVCPFFPLVGYFDSPLLGMMCVKTGDFADGAQFTVTAYGATHTYLVCKLNSAVAWGNQTTNSIAIRYE